MKPNGACHRGGLTIVELVVVIAIAIVCLGMLLGAIQAARLSAARQAAINDVRQLVLATHQFSLSNNGALPNVDGALPAAGRSVFQAISPYLEAHTNAPPPLLRAKTDPSRWPPANGPSAPILPGTVGSPADQPEACSFVVNPFMYAIGAQFPTTLKDGSSTTIAITEHYGTCGPSTFYWSLTQVKCIDGATDKPIPCVASPTHRPTFADSVHDDVLPITSGEVTIGTPPQTFQVRPTLSSCDPRVPQSSLPGGIILGMADGSVRFTSQGIGHAVFWGAVTPNSGEVISLD